MVFTKQLIGILICCMITDLAIGQTGADVFSGRVSRGKITHPEMHEVSGIVESTAFPGHFWVHNDSGDSARIFLIDSVGVHKSTFYLQGIQAYDWEDIAWMNRDGRSYLLIGDIGDNHGRRDHVKVHLLEEPMAVDKSGVDTIARIAIRSFVLTYEDGPRDAESLFYDPVDEALYLISKRELAIGVYRTLLPDMPQDTLTLTRVCTLPYTFFTGADIQRDGSEFIAKNLLNVFYWRRNVGESICAMLGRPAIRLPYDPEPQGEAITFDRQRNGYFTLSEKALGMDAVLYFYPRTIGTSGKE